MVLTVSCSIIQKKVKRPLGIFNHGTYYHDVKVTLKESVLNFRGINRFSKDDIHLIFLSSFGSTLLSYHQQLSTGKHKLYFNSKQLQVNKTQVYSIIKYILRIYKISKGICSKYSCHEVYDGMSFSYDLIDGAVTKIKIKKKNMIKINIQVVGFEDAKKN